jgi:hypothetical protein
MPAKISPSALQYWVAQGGTGRHWIELCFKPPEKRAEKVVHEHLLVRSHGAHCNHSSDVLDHLTSQIGRRFKVFRVGKASHHLELNASEESDDRERSYQVTSATTTPRWSAGIAPDSETTVRTPT